MQQQNREELKAEMLSAISGELDQWLAVESQIKDGYEYESRFLAHARNITNVLLQKSAGKVPASKNKKNSIRVQG
jgi:hypothetical protein